MPCPPASPDMNDMASFSAGADLGDDRAGTRHQVRKTARRIGPESRKSHAKRVGVADVQPVALGRAVVLLLDDIWTTGSRIHARKPLIDAAHKIPLRP